MDQHLIVADGDGAFRLADAGRGAEIWAELRSFASPPCRAGDFDKDGAFRLADAAVLISIGDFR